MLTAPLVTSRLVPASGRCTRLTRRRTEVSLALGSRRPMARSRRIEYEYEYSGWLTAQASGRPAT